MNITFIISTFISVAGLAFVGIQICESTKLRKQELKVIKLNNSIESANEFSQLLSDSLNFILHCIRDDEYKSVINGIDDKDMIAFDKQEFIELSKKHHKLNNYIDYFSSNKKIETYFDKIVSAYIASPNIAAMDFTQIAYLSSCKWKLSKEEEKILKSADKTHEKYLEALSKRTMIAYYKTLILTFYGRSCNKVLNTLEYMAMKFTSGIADDEVVYQSLHQVFLKTVKYFYPAICNLNNSSKTDKYYTHVIQLYGEWVKKTIQKNGEDLENRKINNNKII